MQTVQILLLALLTVIVVTIYRRLLEFRAAVADIQDLPGFRVFFSPSTVWGNVLPRMKGICVGKNNHFINKHEPFEKAGWDIISVVSVHPQTNINLDLADAAAIKEVTSSRYLYPKPVHHYAALKFFGNNIVASEGDEWKKYRKISAPAFSDRNNRLVWDETCSIMTDLFDNVWGTKEEISLDHVVEITLQIALAVIAIAGFGQRLSWTKEERPPGNHAMTFKDALHIVSTNTFTKLAVPEWAFGLTKHLRDVRIAFTELEDYMIESIHARKSSGAQKVVERYDLFSSLLDANEDEVFNAGDVKLTTRELTGNIFIFQLAGHETTAHTLAFVFGLLALYQDEQDRLYSHIKEVLPDGRLPTYEELPKFSYSMAVFYETLRMFPPVPIIPKWSSGDTTITATNATGEKRVIPVPKGTDISINTPALHYNPRYWEDPYTFKPARFLEDWPKDAFVPFSVGARACLGRKFFETEGIAILTMLLSRYSISVKQEPEFVGETFEQTKARILRTRPGLTLAPVRVPLVFKRRI